MQIVPVSVASAEAQLARSEALLRAAAAGEAPATMRWYTYDAPALILGVGQKPEIVDEAACRATGVSVVKRNSGGGVVVAGPDLLALDVVLPAAHPLAGSDVVEAYRWLGEAFRDALVALAPGYAEEIVLVDVATARADREVVRTAVAGSRRACEAVVCFGTLSPYEVGLRRDDGQPLPDISLRTDRTTAGDPGTGPRRLIAFPAPQTSGGAGIPGARLHPPPRYSRETERVVKLVGLSQIRRRGVVAFQAGVYLPRREGGTVPRVEALLAGQDERVEEAADCSRLLASGRDADLGDIGLGEADVPRLMAAVNEVAVRLSGSGRGGAGGR